MGKLTDLTNQGDELEMLKCLRFGIAEQLEQTNSGRDMAALSKQFIDISARIAEIEKLKPKTNRRTPLDVAKKKRKKTAPREARA